MTLPYPQSQQSSYPLYLLKFLYHSINFQCGDGTFSLLNGYKGKDIDLETQKLKALLQKYNAGQASTEEKAWLEEWYDQLHGKDIEFDNEEEREKIKQDINIAINHYLLNSKSESEGSKTYYWIKWAAFLALMAVGTVLYLYINSPKPQAVVSNEVSEGDIAPGGNKATLTLADGSKIALNERDNGILLNQGNTAINKTEDGKVVYEVSGSQSSTTTSELNHIATPRGGKYQITLSDGTKVWLNAASSLTFPTVFTGKERNVELKGEAYFEVAKNKAMPFKVKINDDIHLKVLGTHFNIMAYRDEPEVKTTLLEGSVKISNKNASSLLKPGEQASIGKGNRIKVSRVNTEEAVAWKNGYFIFTDESLASIMRKLSKWYDADIVYQNIPDNLYFGGMVSRSKNISAVLKIMELTGNVHFKISPGDSSGKERRIVVMP